MPENPFEKKVEAPKVEVPKVEVPNQIPKVEPKKEPEKPPEASKLASGIQKVRGHRFRGNRNRRTGKPDPLSLDKNKAEVLKEFGGNESDIPVNHSYWKMRH